MFSSPQTVTINAVPFSCHAIKSDASSTTYSVADGTVQLKVSHQETKTRIRRMVRIDKTVIASDPLTAENGYQRAGIYIVVDEPIFGFNDEELEDLVLSLTAWLSSANIQAVLASRH